MSILLLFFSFKLNRTRFNGEENDRVEDEDIVDTYKILNKALFVQFLRQARFLIKQIMIKISDFD